MNTDKVYPLFQKKINELDINSILKSEGEISQKSYKGFQTIVTFENIENRDQFVSKETELEILKTFNMIPSIAVSLTKEQIVQISKDILITRIEEDQKLYLSILEVNEIITLNQYRKAQYSFTGKNVSIGIIDNGINLEYDSIWDIVKGKVSLLEKDTLKIKKTNKEITHGTLMANIIGNQYLDYEDNIIGIAPNAQIIDVDISNHQNEYKFSNILEIFDRIIEDGLKLDIILISFTTLNASDGKDILSQACNFLVDKGTIIVCPAGNFGPESYTIGSPSAAENVITIGALKKDGTIAYYSGRGPTLNEQLKPDFVLPGSKINIPFSNKATIEYSGTSVSAAIATGIIALLKDYKPTITSREIKEILKTISITLLYDPISQGFGTLDIVSVFKKLGLYQERVLPYKYLTKRALKLSIESFMFFIILFYIGYYFF